MSLRRLRGSNLKGPLLMQTLARLEELKAALEEDERAGVSEHLEEINLDNATGILDHIIDGPRAKALGPLNVFTSVDLKENLGIERGDHLAFRISVLKTFERGQTESATQGGDNYMTSKQMYQHLNALQSSVPRNVSGRQWVNTILLRVSAMVTSQTEGMVFNSEDITPGLIDPLLLDSDRSVPTTSPIIHTAVLASNIYKPFLLSLPSAFRERRLKRLLVVEAMPGNAVDSVPYAINQMHWAAVSLKQKIIRGALTDGFTWTFIVLRLNEGTRGGMYSCSTPFRIPHEGLYPFRVGPSTVEADVVTGILAHWLQHGVEDIDQCDEKEWFQRFGDDGVPVESTCPL